MIKVIGNVFKENAGYFKITLENNDKLLLTRREYGEMKIKSNHSHLMFESTGGNFYKPFEVDGFINFKTA